MMFYQIRNRFILLTIFLLLTSIALITPMTQAANINSNSIPAPLKPWVPWVLEGHGTLKCPFINQTDYKQYKNHLCAWPSALDLAANDDSGSFSQSWRVIKKSWLPLPGDNNNWPQNVTVNGKPAEVIKHNQLPSLYLPPGNYQLRGQFDWQRLPQSLHIPVAYAFVNMTINGRVIAFPKMQGRELWLRELEVSKEKRDAVTMTVHRKISDGTFLNLQTRIRLNVSGKMREEQLGKLLPKGFTLTGISGDIPAFLDADGVVYAKLKPGNWQITIAAHAAPTLLNWQRPEKTNLWPEQEIWAFEAAERFRVGKLSGAKMIDANLANLPPEWVNFPSYLVMPDDVINYSIQHRGKPLQLENQLTLRRKLWLSFDQSQYTFNDTISGSMINEWRLSMPAPSTLQAGDDRDGPMLITSLRAGERGIENRYPNVDIQARGVMNTATQLPVSGWDSHFETVNLTLNLPPANRLFAVFGADSVSNSWLSSWDIWASFIILFCALIAGRVISVTSGVITGVMLLLIYQEVDAPIMAITNLILAIAIYKFQPFERLKSVTRIYFSLSAMAGVAAVLYFSAMQLRSVIHPQLEIAHPAHYAKDLSIRMESAPMSRANKVRARKAIEPSGAMIYSDDTSNRQMLEFQAGNNVKERYQADALVQTGSGIPDWSWHRYEIDWSSPVSKDQQVDMVILSPLASGLLKCIGVLFALLWLYAVLKPTISKLKMPENSHAATALLLLFFITPMGIQTVQANDFPSQQLLNELTKRVTAAPKCAPDCATISNLNVSANADEITLKMQIHALSDTAISLPKSVFWRPQHLTVNGKRQTSLYRHQDWIHFLISKGINTVTATGRIARVDQLQLHFKDMPKRVTYQASDAWDIIGIKKGVLTNNTVEFIATLRKQQTDDSTVTRYSTTPFVYVKRRLTFNQTWKVSTQVIRVAPTNGSISLNVKLLPGEHVTSAGIAVENGEVAATIATGAQMVSWQSMLDRQAQIKLTADTREQSIEQWQIQSSPAWHLAAEGLPQVLNDQESRHRDSTFADNDRPFSASFFPYAGETLTLNITRPESVKGHILAIDQVDSTLEQGKRTALLKLNFDYRSTRGGEHIIDLPLGYQLKEILNDGQVINLQPDGLKLAIPISPGKHTVQLLLRGDFAERLMVSAPTVNLNAPVSNIRSRIKLVERRWVLWTQGPVLGPAVVYWGELLVFILLALLLAKFPFSPLNTVSWLLLGLGLSLNNWPVLILVAFWFASLTASKYRPAEGHWLAFNLSQLMLYALSIIALIGLIKTIPQSLLGAPDMGIVGNQSSAGQLIWFADQSNGLLPAVSVLSLPTLVYKGIMLLWVLWLSFSLLGWIKWAWKIIGQRGYWRSKPLILKAEVKAGVKAEVETEKHQ